MNQLTTYRWSFDEDLHYCRRAGFEAIGVWRQKLTDFGVERAVEMLDDSGMTVSNLLWAGGFTGNDDRSLPENVADAKSAIQVAALLRAGCLVLYTGGRNNHTVRHAERLVRSAVDELLPVAERHGVPLAIEPMHPACAAEWTVLTRLEDALQLVHDYDSRYLKIVYDTYHFPLAGADLSLLVDAAPQIGVVHLSDSAAAHSIDQERCLLGDGFVELEPIIQTLLDAGYRGDFDVELMGSAVEATDYQTVLSASRAFFDNAVAVSSVQG